MLNTPYSDNSYIIEDHIDQIVESLHKEGFTQVDASDISYQIFDRCEHLGIKSEILYPDQDLPTLFGVYRGYNGGGMHSGLGSTEYDRLQKNRHNKAARILELFKNHFWAILKEWDQTDEEATGESKESWDSLAI